MPTVRAMSAILWAVDAHHMVPECPCDGTQGPANVLIPNCSCLYLIPG